MNKFKKILTVGIMCLTLTGCITPQTQAREIKPITIEKKMDVGVRLIYNSKIRNNTERMQETVQKAMRRVNKTPYVFSGSSVYGWDCSGMVVWVYEKFGLTLPHSATAQAAVGKRVKNPKLGDIVVFGYKGYKSFYHSAIYIGKGKVVNANSGARTTIIEPITNYKNSRVVYIRVVPTA
jgi:cell wall-associated NlpC family hydrolase